MRTTLDLDGELLRAAKRRAAEQRTTLTAVLEDSLRRYLRDPGFKSAGFELKVPRKKGWLRPGANVDDRDALYDLMDGRST